MLDTFPVFLNLLGLPFGPTYDQSWSVFHVHLKRMCLLLLLDEMFCKYQFSPSILMCYLRSVFPYWFYVSMICPWWNWGIKVIIITLLLYVSFLWLLYVPYRLRCFYVGCIYTYNYYIFLLHWPLDYYVVSFVSCCKLFLNLFCLI